ncbi:MAG: apolipoprotein N-acyltransferase [Candidatus Deferrimicrobiaceae bacterium]
MRSRLSSYMLPLLSGLFLGTSNIPFPPWALFFCFVPLWLFWLREGSIRKILWGSWLAQFLFCLVAFHWVAHTAHEFGRMPWPAALLVLLLFCAFGHLFFVLAGLTFALLRLRLGLSRAAQLALLPCVTALCWRFVPMLFPWNLGYPWLGARLPAFQLAEYIGFDGLGVLTLFLNLPLLAAWEHRKERKGAFLLGGTVGLLLLLNGAGWIAGKAQPTPDGTARILVVQGNIGNRQKVSAETLEGVRERILRRYFRLTEKGLALAEGRMPDFAVWPETAFPDILPAPPSHAGNAGALMAFVRFNATPMVTGALGHDEASGRKTNSMVFIDRDGGTADRPYNKTHLLTFGEHVPLSGAFPGIRRWFPRTGNFAPGPGPGTRRIAGIRVGPQICYEGLFPDFSRELAVQGAQIFVNVTNDSWFGTSSEPYQHLTMTMARGIEFRRPVVRATNTGISAAMRADGTPLEHSPLRSEWTGLYEIPSRKAPPPTFYQEYGFRLVPAVLWLTTVILLATKRMGRQGGS